jgi:LPXTG-site transpeptidase (sortase) family protein
MPAIQGRWKYAGAALLACALLAIGAQAYAATGRHPANGAHSARLAGSRRHPARPARPARATASAAAWTIDIPGIGVSAPLVTLGDPVGDTLPVPTLAQAKDVGWYQFTALPGTPGNAVVVGHVDTYTSAAVFYDLYLLVRGDLIYVDMGGTRVRFRVTSVRMVSKDQFPVSQVFGTTGKHLLWLITCGGDFDYATRHYLDNLVVSAVWQPVNTRKRAVACNNCHHESATIVRGINETNHCAASHCGGRGGAGRSDRLGRPGGGRTA